MRGMGVKMKCKCGKELGPINWDGMCLKCYDKHKNNDVYADGDEEPPLTKGEIKAVRLILYQHEMQVKTTSFTGDEPYASEIKP